MQREGIHIARLLAVTIAMAIVMPACRREPGEYKLTGQIIEKKTATGEVVVKHDEIPGFMPAMTMLYKVKDTSALGTMEPGDMIVAALVASKDGGTYYLERIRVTDTSKRGSLKQKSTRILSVGESVPDIKLVNQDGESMHLSEFRGKAVLVTFIYTRCPMPAFCPRLSAEFSRIHKNLVKTPKEYEKVHLLTVSFDPKYDTPAILRTYGLAYLGGDASGFSHWDFAAGTPVETKKLADAMGLIYDEEADQIAHTMVVALIAPDGTLAQSWGTEWTAAELENALRHAARRTE